MDREKVIDNLEFINVSCKNRKNIKAYDEIDREMYADWEKIIENTLELLKAQEPIEPEMIMDGLVERFMCKCGAHLFKCENYRWNYCPRCGAKMKWE